MSHRGFRRGFEYSAPATRADPATPPLREEIEELRQQLRQTTQELLKAKPSGRHYDTEMIRDFLNHLTWDLQAQIYHHSHLEEAIPEEIVQNGHRYSQKYDTRALTKLLSGNIDPGEYPEVVAALHPIWVNHRREQLFQLNNLVALFQEALECAASPYKLLHDVARYNDTLPPKKSESANRPDALVPCASWVAGPEHGCEGRGE